jgi:hypothetical protein
MSRSPGTADADGIGGVIETPLPREATLADADLIMPSASAQPMRKPLPAWERQLPTIYLVLLAIAVGCLIFYPRFSSAYNVTLALTVLLSITMSTSWNIISGFTGYTSFGHAGFSVSAPTSAPC